MNSSPNLTLTQCAFQWRVPSSQIIRHHHVSQSCAYPDSLPATARYNCLRSAWATLEQLTVHGLAQLFPFCNHYRNSYFLESRATSAGGINPCCSHC